MSYDQENYDNGARNLCCEPKFGRAPGWGLKDWWVKILLWSAKYVNKYDR